jgi:hypothetical protein
MLLLKADTTGSVVRATVKKRMEAPLEADIC